MHVSYDDNRYLRVDENVYDLEQVPTLTGHQPRYKLQAFGWEEPREYERTQYARDDFKRMIIETHKFLLTPEDGELSPDRIAAATRLVELLAACP